MTPPGGKDCRVCVSRAACNRVRQNHLSVDCACAHHQDASLHPRVPLAGGLHPWSRPPSSGPAAGVMVRGGAGMEGAPGEEDGAGLRGVRWEQEQSSSSSSACPSEPWGLPCSPGCASGHLGARGTPSLLEPLHGGGARRQPRAGRAPPRGPARTP